MPQSQINDKRPPGGAFFSKQILISTYRENRTAAVEHFGHRAGVVDF
jgi:hypothetical protein